MPTQAINSHIKPVISQAAPLNGSIDRPAKSAQTSTKCRDVASLVLFVGFIASISYGLGDHCYCNRSFQCLAAITFSYVATSGCAILFFSR